MTVPATTTRLRVRPRFKAWAPAEHGLWAWVGVPLLAALLHAPHAATALAVLGALFGFLACNAASRWLRRRDPATGLAALVAAAPATLATLSALALAPAPLRLAATLAGAGLAALGIVAATRGRYARTLGFELTGLTVLTGLGAGIALSARAAPGAVAATFVALLAWQALGVAFVQRALATVLHRRAPDPARVLVAAALAVASAGVGWTVGHPVIGLLPLVYPLRVVAHRPVTSPRDAKRVGLAELGWSVALVVASAALA